MSAEDPGSITGWLEDLKAGRPEAVDAIWAHYYQRVVALVRRRLKAGPLCAVEDDEDVALSVIQGLCEGAVQGRFERMHDRVDLWQLLAAITVKKTLARGRWYARQKRGGSRLVNGQVAVGSSRADDVDNDDRDALAQAESREPSPDSAAIVAEQVQELLDSLPDLILRQIAEWRMDGLSNAEIAGKMGCTVRTVERKLERIRAIWAKIGDQTD
jgi:DNA-directed RNA polymerase specialized sigma24 family protein